MSPVSILSVVYCFYLLGHLKTLCALWHRLVCWCCLNVHWVPFMTIPQCSQIVVGTSLTQLAGRSPTSSLRDGSMPVLRFWSFFWGGVMLADALRRSRVALVVWALQAGTSGSFLILPPMWTGTHHDNRHFPLLFSGN